MARTENSARTSWPQNLLQPFCCYCSRCAFCPRKPLPVLGVVENFSYLKCPDCGKEIPVFGKSKVDAAAKELGLAVGGKLPIDPSLTELSDAGAFAKARNPYLEAAVCALRVLDVKHETQE